MCWSWNTDPKLLWINNSIFLAPIAALDFFFLRRLVYANEVPILQQLQQEIEYHYKVRWGSLIQQLAGGLFYFFMFIPTLEDDPIWLICINTVDGRNPKQPPGMVKTL